jgi:hypothetical protein
VEGSEACVWPLERALRRMSQSMRAERRMLEDGRAGKAYGVQKQEL